MKFIKLFSRRLINLNTKKDLLSSVQNAFQILRLFTLERPEFSITEMSSALNLNASTTHRLVTTLSKYGYLDKNKNNRHYVLGSAFFRLGEIVTSHLEIHKEAQPILQDLAAQVDEAVHLGVLEKENVVILHKIECKNPVRLVSGIGKGLPAFCSATGRAILAFQPKNIIEQVLQSKMTIFTSNTVIDSDTLREYLKSVTKLGYALSINELHNDVVCISVPVRDYTGDVIASISIAGPRYRIKDDHIPHFVQKLEYSADMLSKQLGYIKEGNNNARK